MSWRLWDQLRHTHTHIQQTSTNDDVPVVAQLFKTFPIHADYQWQSVISGLSSPVGLTHAGDGSNRLFILEQEGLIRILENGQLLPTPFLDIRSKVGSEANEQGLLGLAFHPNYS